MGNVFQKAAEKTKPNGAAPEESKIKNPFGSNSAAPSPNAKVSNPFARRPTAESAGPATAPSTPPASVAAKEDSPASEVAAEVPKQVDAEEFVHESQPASYPPEALDNLQIALAQLEASFGTRKEAVADAIRLVGAQIQEHPALCKIMKPEEWGIFVTGLRESYGTAIVKKSERREKSSKKQADVDEAVSVLAGIDGFNF